MFCGRNANITRTLLDVSYRCEELMSFEFGSWTCAQQNFNTTIFTLWQKQSRWKPHTTAIRYQTKPLSLRARQIHISWHENKKKSAFVRCWSISIWIQKSWVNGAEELKQWDAWSCDDENTQHTSSQHHKSQQKVLCLCHLQFPSLKTSKTLFFLSSTSFWALHSYEYMYISTTNCERRL